MFKRFIPFLHAKTIFEIPPSFYKETLKVKYVFIDLDNTLDSYKISKPTERTLNYINSLKEIGLNVIIVSNNRNGRVLTYSQACDVICICKACKPFSAKINRFIKTNKISKQDIIFVGDQMMTDVLMAYHAKIRVIFTEKIVKEDQWTTRINRLFERVIKKYHIKHNNLKDWRNYNG